MNAHQYFLRYGHSMFGSRLPLGTRFQKLRSRFFGSLSFIELVSFDRMGTRQVIEKKIESFLFEIRLTICGPYLVLWVKLPNFAFSKFHAIWKREMRHDQFSKKDLCFMRISRDMVLQKKIFLVHYKPQKITKNIFSFNISRFHIIRYSKALQR